MPENYAETLHNPAKTAGISCPSLKYLQQMYGRCLHSASWKKKTHKRVNTLKHLETIKLLWPHFGWGNCKKNERKKATDSLFDRQGVNDINGVNMAGMNHQWRVYQWICRSHTSSCTPPLCRSGSCCRYSLRTRTGRRHWPACRSTSGYYSPDMCPGPEPGHSGGPRERSLQEKQQIL